ncbi:hypothetical protein [Novosphingobium sp. LASN5T]|uniref:hypothetical protein n=1 Tax=Novosphingobium sp. LASN5T TaxID=2491021 RepID=UPI000F5FFCA6|nr:hypothetical protein [Novosphingobium sp. LASN5T]RQW39245.1 hypothetical protein EH199_22465 [Novosphingobium sp. LASN5T]
MRRNQAVLVMTLLLAACGGGTGVQTSGGGKAATIRSVGHPPPRPAAQIQTAPGLESVIGADAQQLSRLFGPPRLDIREEDARKLQWSGSACILDVFLYPPAQGGRQTATYVDARRGDGRDVDRAACIAALKKP